ncbi:MULTISPECIES: NAD(P)H-dependent oxidoreductase [unclassified Enterococcus]|uniref:NAD(P)H-dependent oxidoreductase n=1 Tax=unclassified Enterococcus TaxID=2608891 RepID=UPI00155192CD|nr:MULTISPECIES: NAD(P)H-dependent oxidoreductase [unclassified Enterococcus]MBS7578140.1 NAD(P)H-dependent oxidoreductase [Enterococcus sp. MMGLQ5-2]MBS7584044.1 NAD(P)H-dependent oxidoreductase [Enterococcus sp. MMGLQ5-1]NPD11905.1 NAD(P)H-dependent oxidoreductase [Enterococcus sp. MMGLQ5-1]NPD37971.1 NAD(P)H-dependent oxidoreductase [Enterococcus sp. MMGLQ5-2]
MNILLIYTYPNHEGFNHAIKEAVISNINPAHQLKIIDLYEENFNPVLFFDGTHQRRNLNLDQETSDYRAAIEWSEFIIFIYPIWWSSMPAILKGFIDRVFAKGFAYQYKGLIPIGLLKNKRAWIINTHDSPLLYASLFQKDYGRILSKQILKMCGISTYKHSTLSFVRGSNEKKRKQFLKRLALISSRL